MKNFTNELFKQTFHKERDKLYFSPGRVNIIGGHTDYNGGAVLPFCIDFGIYGAVSKRTDNQIHVFSDNIRRKGIISFALDQLEYDENRNYANYISGLFHELHIRKYVVSDGFDLVIAGNLPRGGGLSSSAALLVLVCNIVNDLNNFGLDGVQIALISKAVENLYIGVNCGIMDQFIIANGKKDHAIYLESNTLNYEFIPCNMEDYKFVLVNSNITRRLKKSKYNLRQKETQDILAILKQHVDIEYICDLLPNDYEQYEAYIEEEDLKKRFKHLVNEHDRVKQAKIALSNNDFVGLGMLLTKAHESARDLYEVSSLVLDRLVVLAMDAGSLGSKMIGGGFGGSTLNLVETSKLDGFIDNFTELYIREYNSQPIINVVKVTDGACELKWLSKQIKNRSNNFLF